MHQERTAAQVRLIAGVDRGEAGRGRDQAGLVHAALHVRMWGARLLVHHSNTRLLMSLYLPLRMAGPSSSSAAAGSSGGHAGGGSSSARRRRPPPPAKTQSDEEMEEALRAGVKGDPMAEFDVSVDEEGAAIQLFLSMLQQQRQQQQQQGAQPPAST